MRKLIGCLMAALVIGLCPEVLAQALVTPTPPTGVEISKAVVNLSKPNGGPFEPGDILQIRATIFNNTAGNTRFDEVRFQDVLPANVTYVAGTRAIRNNEGRIIIGNMANTGASSLTPNFNLLGGPFVESGAGSRGSFVLATNTVTITIGSGAGDAVTAGGIIGRNNTGTGVNQTGNYFPIQSGGLLIVATYHVQINSGVAPNTIIDLGAGNVRLGTIGSTAFTEYVFNTLPIVVFAPSAGAPRLRTLNNITIANNGTFGRGATRNGAALGTGTGLNRIVMADAPTITNVGDGNYAVIKNSANNDGAANVLANEMFNQNATNTIWGGLDIVGDHTGAVDGAAGNPPALGTAVGGYFLLVNSNNSPTTVFSENLTNVCPQSPIEISYWLRNMCPNCNNNGYTNGTTAGTWNPSGVPAGVVANRTEPGVLPNIAVTIDGRAVAQSGNIAYDRPGNRGVHPDTDPVTGRFNTWKFKRLSLVSGAATTYAFALVNNSPGGGGNDWALDDIRVSQVVPDMLNLGDPLPPICPNTELTLRTNISSLQITQSTYNFYKWQRSTNNGANWLDVAGSEQSVVGAAASNYVATLVIPASQTGIANNGVLYRVVAATSAANLGGTNITGTCADVGPAFKLNIANSTAFCRPPVANNQTNEAIVNTAAATAIGALQATDQDGSIVSFTIGSLPNASHGVLLLGGLPVAVGQVLTPAQAQLLQFDPQAGFVGNASFTFFATDNSGFVSNTATTTIPIVGSSSTPPLANNQGAVLPNTNTVQPIPSLLGMAAGTATISNFTVQTVPTAAQGTLFYWTGGSIGSGTLTAITAGTVLTPAQSATLQFQPALGASNGTFNFSYINTDSEGQSSPVARYSITLIAPGSSVNGQVPPVAANIANSAIPSNAGSQLLLPLSASDADGSIVSFQFGSVPLAAQGNLQFWSGGSIGAGTLTNVTTSTVLTLAQASALVFTPNINFSGSVALNYTATDNSGRVSSPAVMSIPVTNRPPIANPILTPALNRTAAATLMPALSGFDPDGSIVQYNITNVSGLVGQGSLLYRIGGSGAITAITDPINLTPAEAASLQFDPAISGTSTLPSFDYRVSDNAGQFSATTSYSIPLRQFSPPLVEDVVFNRTEGIATAPTPTRFIPNTATWTTAAGIAVTHLNDPIATDADGTIASYQILSLPDRGTNGAGRLRFPCDAACRTTLPSLFTQGCNGTSAGTGAGFTSGDDGCLPAGTRFRVNSDDAGFVEIVDASVPVSLSLTQMQALQFNPRNPTQGSVFTFNYTAVDNDGFTGNTARYFVPVSGTGLTTPPYALNRISTPVSNTAVQAAVAALSANDDADGGSINRYEIQSIPPASQGTLFLCTPACVAITGVQTISVANAGNLRFTPSNSFTGSASFTYIAYDNDNPQKNSNVAQVSIPVTSSGVPAADPKEVQLVNTAPATSIPALSGTLVGSGSLQLFTINTIPNATSQGVLTFFNGTSDVPVSTGQALTQAQAATLRFDPLPSFRGNAIFTYSAQSFDGINSNPATYTIRVSDPPPFVSTVSTQNISKAAGATSLASFPLLATDNGSIVSYTIRNLPDLASGTLRLCSGPCVNVTAGQVISPAQASQLQFVPALSFTGSVANFNYTATDNTGQIGNVSTYKIPLQDPISLAGTVFRDANGLTDNLINGTPTNLSGQLYISALQNGVAIATTAVAGNGQYQLSNIAAGNVSLVLHNVPAGSIVPIAVSGFVFTGEGTLAAGDGTPDGLFALTNQTTNVTAANFGVNAAPVASNINALLGGKLLINIRYDLDVFPLAGNDAEDGPLQAGSRFAIATVPPAADATLFYNGVALSNGTIINNYDPDLLQIRFNRVFTSPGVPLTGTSFQFRAVDAANTPSNAATYSIGLANVLPVVGLELKGSTRGTTAVLNWKTLQETQTDRFLVERSENGVLFKEIGGVAAAGNSNREMNYAFTDQNTNAARLWYRVKLVEKDGTQTLSNVVALGWTSATATIRVYPNPAREQLYLFLGEKGTYQTDLLNAAGQVVWSRVLNAADNSTSLLPGLGGKAKGMYLLKVTNKTSGRSEYVKVCFE